MDKLLISECTALFDDIYLGLWSDPTAEIRIFPKGKLRFEKKAISCRLAPLTFESLSSTCLHRPKVGLLIPHTFHNLGVEAYFGEYVESLCNSVQVVQDLLLARICFAPVEILSDVWKSKQQFQNDSQGRSWSCRNDQRHHTRNLSIFFQ